VQPEPHSMLLDPNSNGGAVAHQVLDAISPAKTAYPPGLDAALHYVQEEAYHADRWRYERVLDITRDLKSGTIPIPDAVEMISQVLDGHQNLIDRFKSLLATRYNQLIESATEAGVDDPDIMEVSPPISLRVELSPRSTDSQLTNSINSPRINDQPCQDSRQTDSVRFPYQITNTKVVTLQLGSVGPGDTGGLSRPAWIYTHETYTDIISHVRRIFQLNVDENLITLETTDGLRIYPAFDNLEPGQTVIVRTIGPRNAPGLSYQVPSSTNQLPTPDQIVSGKSVTFKRGGPGIGETTRHTRIYVDNTSEEIVSQVRSLFQLNVDENLMTLETTDGQRIYPAFDNLEDGQTVVVKTIQQQTTALPPISEFVTQPHKTVLFNLFDDPRDPQRANPLRLDILISDTAKQVFDKVRGRSAWYGGITFEDETGTRFHPTFDTVRDGMTIAAYGQNLRIPDSPDPRRGGRFFDI